MRRPLTADQARELLAVAPGVKVLDDPAHKKYPTPFKDAAVIVEVIEFKIIGKRNESK
jgi:aspartate-semialdehyde dehydrogenase